MASEDLTVKLNDSSFMQYKIAKNKAGYILLQSEHVAGTFKMALLENH